ncbi:MAG TPA: hypothetical protein VGM19_07720 [Armatimonadota bacterium]|jgi:hypothetical protein
MTRTQFLSVSIAALLPLALLLPAPAARAAQPAVLALAPGDGETYARVEVEYLSDRAARELREEGFQRGWHDSWADLTLAYLKQFNAVILYDVPGSGPDGPTAATKEKLDLLRTYVEQGGGLYIAQAPYWAKKAPTVNYLLAPLGASVLNELVKDDSNKLKLKSGLSFSWTDAITPGPATAGVKGLYYGVDFFEPASPNTNPVQVNADWQVLVRGLDTAASYAVHTASSEITGPGTISKAPVLVAARSWGKGRIVVWPTTLTYTLLDGYHPILDNGLVMDSQNEAHPSNGARLAYNLLKWLAEPSLSLPGWGGFIYKPVPPRTLEHELGFQTIDWTKVRPLAPMYNHAYLGLIGAQSNLSSGTSSPEELIAAARRAGYEFLVFTEDLRKLSKPNWEKLVAACAAGTDATFAAYPGLYYLTRWGAEYVTFGGPGDLSYPLPEWTNQVNGETRINENNVFVRGLSVVPPIIMVYPHRNPRPLRLNAQYYGFATHTYEANRLVDEAFDAYQTVQKEGLSLFPVAVHFVTNAADVARARAGGLQTYIRAASLATLPRSVQGFTSAPYNNPQWCKPAFASSGPEIQYFYAENWGTSDQAIPGNDRHRLQIMVSAAAGLREVRLYDNAVLWQRFLPRGATTFTRSLDNFHDQQHSYILEVIDRDGGRAVSWNRETNVQECNAEMCGDNWNDMPGGKYTAVTTGDGTALPAHLAGTEFTLSLTPKAQLWPWPSLPNLDGGSYNYAALKQSGLVTRFGWQVDYSLNLHYDGPGWPGGIYENRGLVDGLYYHGVLHNQLVVGRTPKPTYTILSGEVTFLRDTQLKGAPGFVPSFIDGILANYTYPEQGRRMTATQAEANRTGLLPPGEYVSTYPALAALFNLGEEPLRWSSWAGRIMVGAGENGQTMKAGDRLTWQVLTLPGGADPQLAERVRTELGLAGPPAYQVRPRVGSVESTRLFLRLRSQDGGFRGTFTRADLPVVLPVFVSGLNPNWSAGVWYRGENTLQTSEWKLDPWRLETVAERGRDQIQRVGINDGVGFLTVDLDEKDRDLFIGNLLVCDQPELRLTFLQDPGRAYFVAHNPTGRTLAAVVRPGAGFDLYGNFAVRITVPGGSSLEMDLPRR